MAYEVVIIRHAPACVIHGNPMPAREVYPGNEAWGKLGWTCKTLEEAMQRMKRAAVVLAEREAARAAARAAGEVLPDEDEEEA